MPSRKLAVLHEYIDDRGRRYVVRACVGMRAGVVQTALGDERIDWREEWGAYHPNADATAERLFAEYERRQAFRQRGNPDRVNAELQEAAASKTSKPIHQPDSHERQLPTGDLA